MRDTTAVWKRFLPSYNNNSDDDNTKKITRELGIEYDPVTTPRLGIVELDQVWDVLYASVLVRSYNLCLSLALFRWW